MRLDRPGARRRLAWPDGGHEQPPPLGMVSAAVACQIADRLERSPSYGIADARRDNAAGWTVRRLSLGSPCRHDEVAGVRLTDDELRRALMIARRIVRSRA